MQVTQLWRYPVKSMAGTSLAAADVGFLGIDGDRQWGLVDQGTGLVLTARRVPQLLLAEPVPAADGMAVRAPERWEGPAGVWHDSTRTRLSILAEEALDGCDVRRFRPNVVLRGGDERDLVGAQVRIGTVVADVVKEIDRCVVVTC